MAAPNFPIRNVPLLKAHIDAIKRYSLVILDCYKKRKSNKLSGDAKVLINGLREDVSDTLKLIGGSNRLGNRNCKITDLEKLTVQLQVFWEELFGDIAKHNSIDDVTIEGIENMLASIWQVLVSLAIMCGQWHENEYRI